MSESTHTSSTTLKVGLICFGVVIWVVAIQRKVLLSYLRLLLLIEKTCAKSVNLDRLSLWCDCLGVQYGVNIPINSPCPVLGHWVEWPAYQPTISAPSKTATSLSVRPSDWRIFLPNCAKQCQSAPQAVQVDHLARNLAGKMGRSHWLAQCLACLIGSWIVCPVSNLYSCQTTLTDEEFISFPGRYPLTGSGAPTSCQNRKILHEIQSLRHTGRSLQIWSG